jgi:hypothetical protein
MFSKSVRSQPQKSNCRRVARLFELASGSEGLKQRVARVQSSFKLFKRLSLVDNFEFLLKSTA